MQTWFGRVTPERLRDLKRTPATRDIPIESCRFFASGQVTPRTGDILLARVERVGTAAHGARTTGASMAFAEGDQILVVCDERAAASRLGTPLPDRIDGAVVITPLALLTDARRMPLTLRRLAPRALRCAGLATRESARRRTAHGVD